MANSFLSNQGTQTALLTDTTGGTAGTLIPVMKLDISAQGTFTKTWDGNVQGGTIGSITGIGSVGGLSNLPGGTLTNLTSGTINSATVSGNVGVSSGTITLLPNLPGGSIAITTGTIPTLGTMGTLGLVNTVTTVSNITNGSIVQTVGTVNTGTINLGTFVGKDANAVTQTGNPVSIGGTDSGGTVRTVLVNSSGAMSVTGASAGTFVNISTGTLTSGSLTNVAMLNAGTITTLPNIPGGSIVITAGTIATLGTMGTLGLVNTVTSVTGLASGTINVGTFVANGGTIAQLTNGSIIVTAGTVRTDARTTQNIITFGTSYGTSGAGASTIIGSAAVGAGTSVWLNDLSIMNNNANVTCILGFGTAQQGTNVLFRGSLGTAGAIGIEKIYPRAVNAGMTNQDLVFSLTGAGTVDLSVSYLISV